MVGVTINHFICWKRPIYKRRDVLFVFEYVSLTFFFCFNLNQSWNSSLRSDDDVFLERVR